VYQKPVSPFLERLRGRITLDEIPFTDRGSRLYVFRKDARLAIWRGEHTAKRESDGHVCSGCRPMVDDIMLQDENSTPLDFELVSYPHALFFLTRIGVFTLASVDEESLYLHLPEKRCGIAFRVCAEQGQSDRRGGVLMCTGTGEGFQRCVAYSTDARIRSNGIGAGVDGDAQVELQVDATIRSGLTLNITPRLALNRAVPNMGAVLRESEKRWHGWLGASPMVADKFADQYYFAWWLLGAGLLPRRDGLTRQAMASSLTRDLAVRSRDALFHALAYRHADIQLAQDQLRVFLDHQCGDGMIPDSVNDGSAVTQARLPPIQQAMGGPAPPLVAWVALKLYETSGHLDFLEEIYEPLTRATRWWLKMNDDDRDGIVQSNHPDSSQFVESPLWGGRIPVESPELNSFLVMEMDALARIADLIDLGEEADQWRTRAERLVLNLISHSWNTRTGVFWATRHHRPIRILTLASLFPLLTCRLSPAMTQRLVAHISSPEEFWTIHPLSTMARHDTRYDPRQRRQGATWISSNYLVIDGLERCGYSELAQQLRDRTLELLLQHPNLYECYDGETGAPAVGTAGVFGPTSALFVELAIQASEEELHSIPAI
jgi:putative isomerase